MKKIYILLLLLTSCLLANAYNVTFRVDMQGQTGFTTPELNGTFNNWCGGCAPMSDANGDNIWEVTLDLPVGTYEYKFTHDSWSAYENLDPGSSCTTTNSGYTNRFISVTGDVVLPVVCWGSCVDCVNVPILANVTFQVDMSQYNGVFSTPEINGTFNNWCGSCAPMSDANGDNIWEVTLNLPAGTYEYKFTHDSWAGQENLTSGSSCTVTNFGFTNRFISVTSDIILPVVCWGSCADCGSGEIPANVTFQVDMSQYNGVFSTPEINGTFNGWCGNCNPMTDANGDNIWEVTLNLPVGTYEYKFAHDNWTGMENLNPGSSCTITNEGFTNRLISVTSDIILPVFCWGECQFCPLMGCTDPVACNYESTASINDGSCNYVSCLNAQVAVTFNVDMTGQTVSANGVHIAGNFNDVNYDGTAENAAYFNWLPYSIPLVNQGNGIWTVTLNLVPLRYEFKFINGNDWTGAEDIPAACQVEVNGNDNRYWTISGLNPTESMTVCYESCAACGENAVRFRVDMTQEVNGINPAGVFVAGNFNGWNPAASQLIDPDGNGTYEGYFSIGTATTTQFKFINGNDWTFTESVPEACWVSGNREINVAEVNTIADVICFSGCGQCQASTPVLFRVDMSLQTVNANGPHVAGNFQGWNPGDPNTLMTDPDGDNIYEVTLILQPGTYQYKFVNGDAWADGDEFLPADCNVGGNREFTLGYDLIVQEFCYEKCTLGCFNTNGCSDLLACNYDPNSLALINCIYAGCTEPSACNYNSAAGCDDGSCFYNCGSTANSCNEIFISEVVEGWSNNKAIEIYNPTNATIDLTGYGLTRFTNGSSVMGAISYFDGYSIAPHDVFVIVLDKQNPSGTGIETPVWPELQAVADVFINPTFDNGVWPMYFNGNDAVAIVKNNGQTLVDLYGRIAEGSGFGGWSAYATDQTGATLYASTDHTQVRENWVTQGVASNPSIFDVFAQYDVLGANTFDHLGWHNCNCNVFTPGCNDPLACNYNINDQNTLTCQYPGCTNITACNYNANAGCDNGSCEFNCGGGNYSCNYSWGPQTFGTSPNPAIGENFVAGSQGQPYTDILYIKTPTTAADIDPTFPAFITINSMHLDAVLYGVVSAVDTTWVDLSGLGLSFSCNNSGAYADPCTFGPGVGSCGEIAGIPNQTGVFPVKFLVTTNLLLLGDVPYEFTGFILDFSESSLPPGCNDPSACNYNPSDVSASSCQYPGCTNTSACNYNANAGCEDGSCVLINSPCNDNNPNTFNDVYTSSCNCAGSLFSYGNLDNNTLALCSGENTQIAMIYEPVGLPSYSLQWYYKSGVVNAPFGGSTSGWIAIPGATTSVVDVNSFVGSRTYACFVTTNGSLGLTSQWANGVSYVNYSSINAQAIIGNPNITPFNSYTYAVTSVVGNTYNWTVTNGAVISGQGTSVVSILWGQNGPYQVTLTESDGTCSGTSVLFAVNNNCTLAVSAASGTTTSFCSGASVQLQAATTATNITYQWYLNGVAIAGETNQTTAAVTGGNYQVSITQNGCSAISQILAITELPGITMPTLVVDQANAGCSGSDATLSLTDANYSTITWSNGAVNSSSINVSESGSYTVTVTDNNGCTATSSPVEVNLSLVSVVPVCLVTVDEATGKNNVVWEPVTSELINSYVILKETNVANVYAQIGTVAYGSNGLFEDVNSNPQVQANRYKLALIDTCGILSSNSDYHKTIHLSTNQGLGNNVNLIWSGYEGFDFGSYNIYRGASASSMTLLTTIASNLDSYTDINPPAGEVYYMIEVEGVSCDPQRTLVYSHSNVITATTDGVDELSNAMILYPNPATTELNLQITSDLIGSDVFVFDALGKQILKQQILSTNTTINTSSFAAGNYVVKVGGGVKKFNVEK